MPRESFDRELRLAGAEVHGTSKRDYKQPAPYVPRYSSPRKETSCTWILWYTGTMMDDSKLLVERIQTGVSMEKRLLKVLKGFAEYHDMTLGDLLEGIVLHAFDGKRPFGADSLKR